MADGYEYGWEYEFLTSVTKEIFSCCFGWVVEFI
jgi:hypothetical protein